MFPEGWPQEHVYSGERPSKIEIIYDDKASIEDMIAHPKAVLKHAWEYVEEIDITAEAKKFALLTLSMALITIIHAESIGGGR